jgi:hypothetical protein
MKRTKSRKKLDGEEPTEPPPMKRTKSSKKQRLYRAGEGVPPSERVRLAMTGAAHLKMRPSWVHPRKALARVVKLSLQPPCAPPPDPAVTTPVYVNVHAVEYFTPVNLHINRSAIPVTRIYLTSGVTLDVLEPVEMVAQCVGGFPILYGKDDDERLASATPGPLTAEQARDALQTVADAEGKQDATP